MYVYIHTYMYVTSSYSTCDLNVYLCGLFQVSHIHRGLCTAISLTSGGRHIITAGDNSIKIWDYSMALDLNFQVHIYTCMYMFRHT